MPKDIDLAKITKHIKSQMILIETTIPFNTVYAADTIGPIPVISIFNSSLFSSIWNTFLTKKFTNNKYYIYYNFKSLTIIIFNNAYCTALFPTYFNCSVRYSDAS